MRAGCKESGENMKKIYSNRGFSLIEVLVAMAVLGIALVALLHANATCVRNSISTRVLFEASLLAQEKMNELEVNGYQLSEDSEELLLETEAEEEYTRYYDEGDFEIEDYYDETLEWREEYLWQVFLDQTDLDGIAKITVVVYNQIFEERVPPIELVAWVPYDEFVNSPNRGAMYRIMQEVLWFFINDDQDDIYIAFKGNEYAGFFGILPPKGLQKLVATEMVIRSKFRK